ncbi:pyruvate dehydrogenase complex dihydrolipoamide acetyltransferase [Alloalcanivorax gelatiniphagus]
MTDVTMPRLSDTMEEGVIVSWLKQPGDTVEPGDALVEIETDKAIMEFEAYESGVLDTILVPEGERAAIGTVIARLAGGEQVDASPGTTTEEARAASVTAPDDSRSRPANGAPQVGADVAPTSGEASVDAAGAVEEPDNDATRTAASAGRKNSRPDRLMATPLVRRLASENGVDLAGIDGTGPGGRIIRVDIERFLATVEDAEASESADPDINLPATSGATTVQPATSAQPASPPVDDRRDPQEVEFDSIRRVVARRLSASAREVPHFFVTAIADVEDLVSLRADLNARLEADGRAKVSINDLLVRACALALRAHPLINASFRGDSESTMFVHRRINVGVAVASQAGLVVPVIEDADRKTVTEIGTETKELVALANDRKLSAAQMTGGTFTISNLGMFGVDQFTAIINPPEGAILAVGATVREPVAVGADVVIRHRTRLTLSCDHRIIDGAQAAQFLQTLTKQLESPWTVLA